MFRALVDKAVFDQRLPGRTEPEVFADTLWANLLDDPGSGGQIEYLNRYAHIREGA